GFSLVGVADSQSVFRELYATMALCAQATRRVRIGPAVTNPVTRHPAVAASGIATIDEIAPGRAFFGIGSGDSAILNLAERPATLAGKHVPGELADAIGRVQKGYQPAAHEALGASPNARLLEAEPALRAYLAERFAAVGPAAVCADKLRGVVEAGIDGLLVTGFV